MLTKTINAALVALCAVSIGVPATSFADEIEDQFAEAKAAMELSDCFEADTFSQIDSCIQAKFDYCSENIWDGSGVTRSVCNNPLVENTDAELNRVYRALMAKMAQTGWAEDELRAAQRSWIETRDLSCDFVEAAANGSGSTWRDRCLADLTLLRIWALRGFDQSLYMYDEN